MGGNEDVGTMVSGVNAIGFVTKALSGLQASGLRPQASGSLTQGSKS